MEFLKTFVTVWLSAVWQLINFVMNQALKLGYDIAKFNSYDLSQQKEVCGNFFNTMLIVAYAGAGMYCLYMMFVVESAGTKVLYAVAPLGLYFIISIISDMFDSLLDHYFSKNNQE